jgi:trans-2,3-dihydro-3-hydroxyanthranilate isomerase
VSEAPPAERGTGSGRHIAWLDVFTDRPFAGNQLAVVADGDGVSDDAMQTFARELAISETVFVVDGGRRLRVWTPGYELPMAGHPAVGAALELARLGRIPGDGEWVFKTGGRDTAIALRDGVATMNQGEPELGLEHDTSAVAAALGIAEEELASLPQHCTTGVRQIFAQVRDREALAALRPDLDLVAGLGRSDGLVAWCEVADGEVAQRFFAPQMGIPEDPATGSAAGALGALRVFRGAAPGSLLVRQGEEIGRPSEMQVEVAGEAGHPTEVRVGGRAVLVFEGRIEL